MLSFIDKVCRFFRNAVRLPTRVLHTTSMLQETNDRLALLERKLQFTQDESIRAIRVELQQACHELKKIRRELSERAVLLGQIRAHQVSQQNDVSLESVEFKVFSQFGDDGIIHYLVTRLKVQPKTFVEFGVEDYSESNTRYLLFDKNWSGLILDASVANIAEVKNSDILWRYDLTAVSAFIDAENINNLIRDNGFAGDVGILSIDIDGNDYWVWKAIDCISPVVVICEFNAVLGFDLPVTIPYSPDFDRSRAHYSFVYYGSSLPALKQLAGEKGYSFVGCNSSGNNAYFIRNSHAHLVKDLIESAHATNLKVREARDENGKLSYASLREARSLISDCPVFDVRNERTLLVKDVLDCTTDSAQSRA